MAGGRLSETFAPRLGWELLWLVPAVAVVASLIASVLLFFGVSLTWGGPDAFKGGLFLAIIAGFVGLPFVLGALALLAVPLSFALRAMKVSWRVAFLIGAVLAVVVGALFGAAQKSADFPLIGIIFALVTASLWLLALHRSARDIQPADIDGVVTAAP